MCQQATSYFTHKELVLPKAEEVIYTNTNMLLKMSSARSDTLTPTRVSDMQHWHIVQISVSEYWFLWVGIRTCSNYWSHGSNMLQSSKSWFRKIRFGHVLLARQIGPIRWIKQLKLKKKIIIYILHYCIIYLYKKGQSMYFWVAIINVYHNPNYAV